MDFIGFHEDLPVDVCNALTCSCPCDPCFFRTSMDKYMRTSPKNKPSAFHDGFNATMAAMMNAENIPHAGEEPVGCLYYCHPCELVFKSVYDYYFHLTFHTAREKQNITRLTGIYNWDEYRHGIPPPTQDFLPIYSNPKFDEHDPRYEYLDMDEETEVPIIEADEVTPDMKMVKLEHPRARLQYYVCPTPNTMSTVWMWYLVDRAAFEPNINKIRERLMEWRARSAHLAHLYPVVKAVRRNVPEGVLYIGFGQGGGAGSAIQNLMPRVALVRKQVRLEEEFKKTCDERIAKQQRDMEKAVELIVRKSRSMDWLGSNAMAGPSGSGKGKGVH